MKVDEAKDDRQFRYTHLASDLTRRLPCASRPRTLRRGRRATGVASAPEPLVEAGARDGTATVAARSASAGSVRRCH